MRLVEKASLRLERQRYRLRARRKRRELTKVVDRTEQIVPGNILSFCTIRNEQPRLPYFLKYYRELGVDHFLFVDNDSADATAEYLSSQPDVSLFTTDRSYRRSRFGVDWLQSLQRSYAHGHWSLVVDIDEFFVYPFCDTRPLAALTGWLDASGVRSVGAMTIDIYPKGPVGQAKYKTGDDPLKTTPWFDAGNYMLQKNPRYGNLWIQGGPRSRVFFSDNPKLAPALNKIPLVKWHRSYAYVSSTHMLLPRGLNLVYDDLGGEKTSGCLLHAKFIDSFVEKSAEELVRGEHFANSKEYEAYSRGLTKQSELWCDKSEKYTGWRQLETLGLMSKGNWA